MPDEIFIDIELHNLKGRLIAAQKASEEIQENLGFLDAAYIAAYISEPVQDVLKSINEYIDFKED